MNATLCLAVIVSVAIFNADSFIPVAADSGVRDIVSFGFKMTNIIDRPMSRNIPANSANMASLISEIQTRIDASSTCTPTIMTTVLLQPLVDRIDNALAAIMTSLIDVTFYFKASNIFDEQHYKELFMKNYYADSVDMHLNFLPDLLTETIPGAAGPLIELFANETRCNLSSIELFEQFYFGLVSDGIAVQFISLKFSNTTLNDKANYWTQQGDKMNATFITIINSCKKQFEQLAKQDIDQAVDVSTLWISNRKRYTWLRSNVLFLYPYGAHKFLYIKYNDNYLIKTKSNRIVIFTDKTDKFLPASAYTLLNDTSILQSRITGDLDDLTAQHVGVAVENYLLDNGYAIRALVVFFDSDKFSAEFIKFDHDSQLMMAELPVALKHCYRDWLSCKLHLQSDMDKITPDKLTGLLKVVAYVVTVDPAKKK